MSSIRHHNWIFTWFKSDGMSTAEARKRMDNIDAAYIVAQEEISPTTKKYHIQGYVHYESAKTFEQVQDIFPGARIQYAIATAKINKKYCHKDASRMPGGRRWEHGSFYQAIGAQYGYFLIELYT